jgi:hypothetical protein
MPTTLVYVVFDHQGSSPRIHAVLSPTSDATTATMKWRSPSRFTTVGPKRRVDEDRMRKKHNSVYPSQGTTRGGSNR